MALDSDLQSAFSDAMDEQLSHLGDTFSVGAVSNIPCFASIVEHTEEDPGGGDRDVKQVRIQCRVSALTAGVPNLHTPLTYQGETYQITTKQTSDDGVSITFIARENL